MCERASRSNEKQPGSGMKEAVGGMSADGCTGNDTAALFSVD